MCRMPIHQLGAAYHSERAIAQRLGLVRYPCGCIRCHGGIHQRTETVAKHHRKYGRDPHMRHPLLVSYTRFFYCIFIDSCLIPPHRACENLVAKHYSPLLRL